MRDLYRGHSTNEDPDDTGADERREYAKGEAALSLTDDERGEHAELQRNPEPRRNDDDQPANDHPIGSLAMRDEECEWNMRLRRR
jgi:hypothetical protein